MSKNISEFIDQSVKGYDKWSRYLLSFLKPMRSENGTDSNPSLFDRMWPFSQANKKISTIDEALKRFEERNPLQEKQQF